MSQVYEFTTIPDLIRAALGDDVKIVFEPSYSLRCQINGLVEAREVKEHLTQYRSGNV